MRIWVLRAVMAVAGALVLTACHQNGTVFAVDVTTDSVDAAPGDGVCADAAGDCSLRAAVMEANATPGVEEIRLSDGVEYTLTIEGDGEDVSSSGDLDITEGVVVAGDALINASGIAEPAVQMLHPAGLVEFDGPDFAHGAGAVRFDSPAGGSIVDAEITSLDGPALRQSAGTVFLWSSTIHHSSAASPHLGTVVLLDGSLSLDNVTVSRNTSDGTGGVVTTDGDVVVKQSTIVFNSGATGHGGSSGISVLGSGSAIVESSVVWTGWISGQEACEGPVTSMGHNVSYDGTCGFSQPSDVVAEYPVVEQLADNGGPSRPMLCWLTTLPSTSFLHRRAADCPSMLGESSGRGGRGVMRAPSSSSSGPTVIPQAPALTFGTAICGALTSAASICPVRMHDGPCSMKPICRAPTLPTRPLKAAGEGSMPTART